MVNNTYGGAVISVRTQVKTLSPCLFALEMDKLTRSIEKWNPLENIFGDDIVLVDEPRLRVNVKLEI